MKQNTINKIMWADDDSDLEDLKFKEILEKVSCLSHLLTKHQNYSFYIYRHQRSEHGVKREMSQSQRNRRLRSSLPYEWSR